MKAIRFFSLAAVAVPFLAGAIPTQAHAQALNDPNAAENPPAKKASDAGAMRSFQAEIAGIDLNAKTVRLLHKPTGFTAETHWDATTRFSLATLYDVDELPDGSMVEVLPLKVLPKNKILILHSGISPINGSAPIPVQSGLPAFMKPLRAKLVTIPVTKVDYPNPILARGKEAAYALEFNGELWRLKGAQRLSFIKFESVQARELRAGMICEAEYREGRGENQLISLQARTGFEPPHPAPALASGLTVEQFEKGMDILRAQHRELAGELRRLMPVSFQVAPELAREGEPVSLKIEAWAAHVPNANVELSAGYLEADPKPPVDLKLDWVAGEQADGLTHYRAEKTMPSLPVGQQLIVWKCDIGGDIQEFHRSYAVAGPGTVVAMFHICSGDTPEGIAKNHLPYDRWQHLVTELIGKAVPGDAALPPAVEWSNLSKTYRQDGVDPVFMIDHDNYTGVPLDDRPASLLFSAEPEALQQAVIAGILETAQMVGYSKGCGSIFGYEIGTGTLRAARKTGLGAIAAFCDYQNYADGSWLMDDHARPMQPYYASADDFRKPARRSQDAIVMINQTNMHALQRMEYMIGVFDACLLDDAITGWPAAGRAGRTAVDEIYVSRLLDAVEDELQVQVNRKTPWFFDMGLQTFRRPKRPVENAEANSVLVDYLLRRVKNGANIVFCEQRGAVEFYRRHYQENPEVVDYDANFNCGVKAYDSNTGAWMPVNYPDVMEIENSRYTAWFKKGEGMLPSYHWDYMKPWHYPDWGNTTLTRSLIGTLIPGEHDKFAVTPLITDTRKMKAAREEKDVDGALEITVQLETPVALNGFPLALWDIPREWKPGDGWWRAHGDARFIPVRAPFTGNLCGILEVVARPGRNEYRVRIGTTRREPRSQDITVDGLEAKVFQRDGRSMAYLWPMHPWDTTIEITVPPGREVQFYAAPEGERVDLKTGANTLVVPKEKWARVVGLSRLELAAALRTIP